MLDLLCRKGRGSSCAGYVKLGIPATNESKKNNKTISTVKKSYAKKNHYATHTHTHNMMRNGGRMIRPSQTKTAAEHIYADIFVVLFINLSCENVYDTIACEKQNGKFVSVILITNHSYPEAAVATSSLVSREAFKNRIKIRSPESEI